jgi:signal transduction histidine kinase
MASTRPARSVRPRRARTEAAEEPESRKLLHELHVHQEELQAQNEKLVAAMLALEQTRDRFVELYDFAPIGYLTLDPNGVVRECNLSAATLLRKPRHDLIGLPLMGSLDQGQRARFLSYLRTCRSYTHGPLPSDEFTLRGDIDDVRTVQLACSPRARAMLRPHELFIAMTDATDRKRLEEEQERARLKQAELVREMMSHQERDRRRMAQDIHDDLGQRVTGLRLKLDWFASVVRDTPGLVEALGQVQEQAAQLDRHVDFLLRQLRPALLDDLGLEHALRQSVTDWSATFGIPAEFQSSGMSDYRLPPDIEAHLFRIVQEALNNVHKHAAAGYVRVVLVRHDGTTTLVVQDDGIGAPPHLQSKTSRTGLGLIGMRERAALIGATLDIRARRGRGTTISLELS